MRSDMFKVIVERPRRGSQARFSEDRHNKRLNDFLEETTQSKIGTRKLVSYAKGYGRKQLNENLQPLVRFLSRSVGRPWDAVFSEICAHIDTNSTVQKHVRDHIRDYVEVDYRYNQADRFGNTRFGRPTAHWFYVDEQGILRTNMKDGSTSLYRYTAADRRAARAKREAKNAETFRQIDDMEIWKVDGIWYTPVWRIADRYWVGSDGIKRTIGETDMMTKKAVKHGDKYRADKKQVDKKTLRKFGVKND